MNKFILVGELHKIGNICLNHSNSVPKDTLVAGFLTPLFSKKDISTAVAPATAKFIPLIEFLLLVMFFITPAYGGISGNPILSAAESYNIIKTKIFRIYDKNNISSVFLQMTSEEGSVYAVLSLPCGGMTLFVRIYSVY